MPDPVMLPIAMELMTPYQTQMVALAEAGVYAVVLGFALLLCLVGIAVVRHL